MRDDRGQAVQPSWNMRWALRPFRKHWLAVICTAFFIYTTVSTMIGPAFPTARTLIYVVLMALVIACLLWMLVTNNGPIGEKVVGDYLHKTRSCPGCGYDLASSLVQSDGCNVCPECGAAWRLDPPDA